MYLLDLRLCVLSTQARVFDLKHVSAGQRHFLRLRTPMHLPPSAPFWGARREGRL